jgi:hypothetical protein
MSLVKNFISKHVWTFSAWTFKVEQFKKTRVAKRNYLSTMEVAASMR